MGGKINPQWGKITPQSEIFKNDAKKLKLSQKVEHIKSFPKHKEKIALLTIFDDVNIFAAKNYKKRSYFR